VVNWFIDEWAECKLGGRERKMVQIQERFHIHTSRKVVFEGETKEPLKQSTSADKFREIIVGLFVDHGELNHIPQSQ